MALPFITTENPMKLNPQSGLIKSWSSTALDNYLECAYRSFLKSVKKVLVELSEEDEAAKAATMERGSELHALCEDHIFGKDDKLSNKIKHRRELVEQYREWYATDNKNVHVEEEWAFDPYWRESDWRSRETWARIKIDAMHFDSETSARIDDWKSGKKYGNEGKHMRQLMVYAVASFMKFPKLQFIKCAMQYIDLATDNTLERNVSREQAMAFMMRLENQALSMTTATVFPPRPNKRNCKFCNFSSKILGTDQRYCEYAVVDI